ncbi:hypothetical protein SAMN05216274_1062 [Cryobacterium levicorallinum]|uniref:Uncharacterized protein n=1 Tax=Cryobacterium levicorallinum TaxID=995038 RepID=A0ABY1ECU2_9MICO|nr:hypothetical protein SAMN05216274_1062 [Cryobacterium levicorallinum]
MEVAGFRKLPSLIPGGLDRLDQRGMARFRRPPALVKGGFDASDRQPLTCFAQQMTGASD